MIVENEDEVPGLAVILSGGEGTRLRPITYEIPKPMIPVKGKPILEHLVLELKRNGVKNLVVTLGYKPEAIEKYFKHGEKFGLRIDYSIENEALGTGGATKLAVTHQMGSIDGSDILVVNGDNLIEIDLKAMYKLHCKEKAFVTLAVKRVGNVEGYGVITVDGNVIKNFVEKPDPKDAESNIINIGVYMLSPEAIRMLPEQKKFSMERDFFQPMVSRYKFCAYEMGGQWFPSDTMERYGKAILGWKPLNSGTANK
jgi:mannose-1-phosphate guanylyltransferase